ncbi:MAG: YbaY family lipoprotein, partial [Pseudomonadota bacterium]
MRNILLAIVAVLASLGAAPKAQAETIEVTVSFRERIALPPDAELNVQILDGLRANPDTRRITAQRLALESVPKTVVLTYDPMIIDADGEYSIAATIWSDGQVIFHTTVEQSVFQPNSPAKVELILTKIVEADDTMFAVRKVTGLSWAATEIAGQAWEGDKPPSLVFDEDMSFTLFGGCNRFNGQAILSERTLAFPTNMAATL